LQQHFPGERKQAHVLTVKLQPYPEQIIARAGQSPYSWRPLSATGDRYA
jgi:hypothetical protein